MKLVKWVICPMISNGRKASWTRKITKEEQKQPKNAVTKLEDIHYKGKNVGRKTLTPSTNYQTKSGLL